MINPDGVFCKVDGQCLFHKPCILDDLSLGLWITDVDTKILSVNKTICRRYDKDQSLFVGKSIGQFISNDYFERLKHEFKEIVETKCSKLNTIGKEDRLRKNGYRIVRTDKVPVLDDKLNVTKILIFSYDITDVVKSEESLFTAHNMLKQKTEELYEFIYMITHDIKTPVFSIFASAELLLDKYKQNEDISIELQHIKNVCNKMLTLADRALMSTEQGIQTRFEVFSSLQVVKECIGFFKNRKENIKFTIFDDYMPTIYGDRVKISEVYQNLIDNAIKFSNPDKQIDIHIGCIKSGSISIFYVRDFGVGIPNDKQDDIFNLSYTTNEEEGYGIGLYLVRQIIKSHQGRVWIDSEVGSGTTVYFTIGTKYDRV